MTSCGARRKPNHEDPAATITTATAIGRTAWRSFNIDSRNRNNASPMSFRRRRTTSTSTQLPTSRTRNPTHHPLSTRQAFADARRRSFLCVANHQTTAPPDIWTTSIDVAADTIRTLADLDVSTTTYCFQKVTINAVVRQLIS